MLTRQRTLLWNDLVQEALRATAQGEKTVAIRTDLVREMERYVNRLNEMALDGLQVFGCNHHHEEGDYAVKGNETLKIARNCDHCGFPVIGPYVNTSYGMFHSHCHQKAQRQQKA